MPPRSSGNVEIWARVSSREQREGYSIDAQLRFNRERAERSGWRVVREFVVAESAKRGAERTAFNDMVAWVKANAKREKIKAILSHKLDRVCRTKYWVGRGCERSACCGWWGACSSPLSIGRRSGVRR
jgi:DNA invertase Pin-like site-specific DNA recombinase